jgi:CP family cyanate transporter-like MFS transporter
MTEARGRESPVRLAIGMVLVAINLRPAAASVGPLLGRIQTDSGLSATGAGMLATLPVLCFGALAPLAPLVARRLGAQTAIAGALVVLLAGLLTRLVPGIGFLFLGTVLAGAAIATCNVLMPVLARRDFSHRTGAITGLYTSALIGFAALSAGVSVPLTNALGGDWRSGLAFWALPVAVALIAWAPALGRRQPDPRPVAGSAVGIRALLNDGLAWNVTLFFALQSAGFYATLSWLPSIFRSHGASESQAGFLLSLSMVVGLLTAIVVPSLATRARDQRVLVVACCVLTAFGWAGILLAPMSAPYLWTVLLGLGQQGAFPLALMLIVLRGGSRSTAGLSTLAQSVGYLLAASGPVAVGAIHQLSGSWTPCVVLLLGLVVPQVLTGLIAGRDRLVADKVVSSSRALGDH